MEWKVFKGPVEILPHPNADSLCIIKVGEYQLVSSLSNGYIEGQIVIVIPDKTVINHEPMRLEEEKYLTGAKKNRVKTVQLRGEVSQGATFPMSKIGELYDNRTSDLVDAAPLFEDISELLGMTKYEPPIPSELRGQVKGIKLFGAKEALEQEIHKHDVYQWGAFQNEFNPDEKVLVTEKIHGCVTGDTKVKMSDGSWKAIRNIELGDSVIGMENNKVVATKVNYVFQNGLSDDWFSVRFSRSGNGVKSGVGTVKVTSNHKFWSVTRQTYVEASELTIGEEVLVFGTNYSMSYIQEQVLIGKMLGDGSYSSQSSSSAKITWGQAVSEYTDYTLSALGDFAHTTTDTQSSGYIGSPQYRGRTVECPQVKEKFSSWITPQGKQIPENLSLTPLSIAFWYMDDGSLAHSKDQQDRAHFAVCSFSEFSIKILVREFHKFGIKATPYHTDKGWRLRLNKDEAEKMFVLISPYIPTFMQYKLPERFRGKQSFLPKSEFTPSTSIQKITSITPLSINTMKWDITTGTHNFFANGILVHNSQVNYVYTRDAEGNVTETVTSKGLLKSGLVLLEENDNSYWRGVRNSKLLEKCESYLAGISAEIEGQDTVMHVIGELVPVQKGFSYGYDKPHVLVYGIQLNGAFVDYDEGIYEVAGEVLHVHNLFPWVPIITESKLKDIDVYELAKGRETVSGRELHIREGVVITPYKMRRDERHQQTWLSLKVISPAYSKKETGDEIS